MSMKPKTLSRRHVLRGAGVALTLPWLESLQPREARGQAVPPRRRFVALYFPLGTPDFWTPSTAGQGAGWKLSPLLEPLAPVKSHVTVLGHVDQTVYAPNGIQPCNGPLTASFLSGVKVPTSFSADPAVGRNGISIDQRIAATLPAGTTPLPSLQLGLSTKNSSCDGTPCAYSRSISWAAADKPLFKLVNPQAVFDRIVSGSPTRDPAVTARVKARKSVLDFVIGNASSLETRLGRSDRQRMDQFLTSVRDLEMRIAASATQPAIACTPMARPTLVADVDNVPADYNRDVHANVMIDLIVMALACDATRVVSLMLDDSRSDFTYDFLTSRVFTATGSTATSKKLLMNPVSGANTDLQNSDWATIGYWYVSKMSLLCQKLAAIPEGAGTLLDNSVVWFGSGSIEEWDWRNLRVLYAGSGGGVLKVDQFVSFASSQSLSNVYLTFLQKVFGQNDRQFGDSTGIIQDILA
jgi:Protein of unknown function (DUF1552)